MLRFLDRHPTPFVTGIFGGGALLAYLVLDYFSDGAVLIGRIEPGARRDLYISLAGTSGALLGFVITSLSILLALPSGKAVDRLRTFGAWRLLTQTLLVAAGLLAGVLVFSTLGIPLDGDTSGCLWLEIPTFALVLAAGAELLVGGIAFAMVIHEAAVSDKGS